MPQRVLVTGATGTVGAHLTRRLLAGGVHVRALCRDPRRAAAVLPASVEPVAGDLTDPAAVRDALHGMDRVFVLLAEDSGAAVADAVRAAGTVEQLVLLSAAAPDGPGYDNPLFRKHVTGEAALHATGVPVTVLRPGPFASLALRWAPAIRDAGTVAAVYPDLAVPVVDPRDVAEVAATVLLEPVAGGPVPRSGPVPLSGPELLDTYDRVRVLGDLLGRPLRVQRVSEDQWVHLVASRLPEPYARALLGVERYLLELRPPVVDTVERLTGRPARTFAAWARDNADAFVGHVPGGLKDPSSRPGDRGQVRLDDPEPRRRE